MHLFLVLIFLGFIFYHYFTIISLIFIFYMVYQIMQLLLLIKDDSQNLNLKTFLNAPTNTTERGLKHNFEINKIGNGCYGSPVLIIS